VVLHAHYGNAGRCVDVRVLGCFGSGALLMKRRLGSPGAGDGRRSMNLPELTRRMYGKMVSRCRRLRHRSRCLENGERVVFRAHFLPRRAAAR
jgi:hypothetical protein